MDPDAPPILRREAAEHLIVQVDELPQQPAGGVELHGETALGEIDLDLGGAPVETLADVRLGLVDEIVEELLPRIAVDPIRWIEQADRRGGDHRLLERSPGEPLRRIVTPSGARLSLP